MPVYLGMFRDNPHMSRTQTLRDDYTCIQLPRVKVKYRKDYFARLVLAEPSLVQVCATFFTLPDFLTR